MLNLNSAYEKKEMNQKIINQVTSPSKQLKFQMYTIFCLSKEKDKNYFIELNFGKACLYFLE